MSILDAFVMPDHVLVGFDTEGTLPDGSRIEGCKAICIPHISAAVAFRGPAALLAVASPSIVGFAGDFDDLAESLPEIIRGSIRLANENRYLAADTEPFNFVLVGFSPALGRMAGHAFSGGGAESEIREVRDFPQLLAPAVDPERLKALGIVADRAGMVAVARLQCETIRAQNAAWPGGGRFFVAEIRQNSIVIEDAFSFPHREVRP